MQVEVFSVEWESGRLMDHPGLTGLTEVRPV
jgi:hypothetical protein